MFADPQSVTYATVAKSLPRVRTGQLDKGDGGESEYQLNDGSAVYNLTLQHQFRNRNRCVARLTRNSVVTDPLTPANSIAASMSATFTLDYPTTGLTTTDAQNLGNALVAWLTSANILRLASGET